MVGVDVVLVRCVQSLDKGWHLRATIPQVSSFACSGTKPFRISSTGFHGLDAISVTQPTVSKYRRQLKVLTPTNGYNKKLWIKGKVKLWTTITSQNGVLSSYSVLSCDSMHRYSISASLSQCRQIL